MTCGAPSPGGNLECVRDDEHSGGCQWIAEWAADGVHDDAAVDW